MKFELEDFHRNVPDDELLADLQRVAAGKKSVTAREYNSKGVFHSTTLMTRFGSWTAACTKLGLAMTISRGISDEDLFRNLEELWIGLGRQPRFQDMQKPLSTYSRATYVDRFGSWRKALEVFVTYISNEENASSEEAIQNCKIEPTTKHKTSRTINWRLRFVVMRRDNFKCRSCGRSPATGPNVILHVDHILAWANGGETVIENLQTLCSVCNIGKSDLEFIEATSIEVQNVQA